MPHSSASLIETALHVLNNILSGLVNLGSVHPLTPMGSTLVNGLAHDAVAMAHFLASIAVHNPIS